MQLCPCCDLCCTLRLQGLFFLIFEGVLELTMFWGGLSPLYLGSCRKCLVRLLQWMRMGLVYQNQVDDKVVLLAVSANRGGSQFHWCLQTFSILRWPQCLWSTPLLDVSHALRVQPGTEMIAANCPLSIHLVTWPMLQQHGPSVGHTGWLNEQNVNFLNKMAAFTVVI